MIKTDMFKIQGSDLNGFLFAEVGTEPSGMTLSVHSTFARIGKDPWQEAASLAELSRPAAIEALARVIAGLPFSLGSAAEATAIAARLVALLPNAAVPISLQSLTESQRQRSAYVLIVLIIASGIFGYILSRDFQYRQNAAVTSEPNAIGPGR